MATTTKPRTSNGARNGATSKMAKPNGTASATKAKAPTVDEPPETNASALLKELRNLVFKEYGVKLQLRDARVSTKIGHATREKLGLDIAAQVKKKGGNKKFDWQRWNTKVFPRLFGQPDALKYPPEVVAILMSLLYDTIRTDPEQAVADLVEINGMNPGASPGRCFAPRGGECTQRDSTGHHWSGATRSRQSRTTTWTIWMMNWTMTLMISVMN
jgi:hypothetical protein